MLRKVRFDFAPLEGNPAADLEERDQLPLHPVIQRAQAATEALSDFWLPDVILRFSGYGRYTD